MAAGRIWTATYRHGLLGPTDVVAATEEAARREAFAAWRYHSGMVDTTFQIDDVVESVRESGKTTYGGRTIRAAETGCPRIY